MSDTTDGREHGVVSRELVDYEAPPPPTPRLTITGSRNDTEGGEEGDAMLRFIRNGSAQFFR